MHAHKVSMRITHFSKSRMTPEGRSTSRKNYKFNCLAQSQWRKPNPPPPPSLCDGDPIPGWSLFRDALRRIHSTSNKAFFFCLPLLARYRRWERARYLDNGQHHMDHEGQYDHVLRLGGCLADHPRQRVSLLEEGGQTLALFCAQRVRENRRLCLTQPCFCFWLPLSVSGRLFRERKEERFEVLDKARNHLHLGMVEAVFIAAMKPELCCLKVEKKEGNGVYSSLFRAKASGGHSKARETRDGQFMHKFVGFALIGVTPARPRVCKCPPPQIPVSQSPF